MFYYMQDLKHKVWMHPALMKHLDVSDDGCKGKWKKIVGHKAWLELEFSFDPDIGHIVQMQRISAVSEGTIQPQTGLIEHNVTYDALVQLPVQGEVIDAKIRKISHSSIIFSFMGIINGIVNYEQFPVDDDYEYLETECDDQDGKKRVGIFVSAADSKRNMTVGQYVRLRIVKRAFGNSGFWLQGSMKNKFLGIRVGKAANTDETDEKLEETSE